MNECGYFSGKINQYFVYARISKRHKWEWTGTMNIEQKKAEQYAEAMKNDLAEIHPNAQVRISFFSDPNQAPYKTW